MAVVLTLAAAAVVTQWASKSLHCAARSIKRTNHRPEPDRGPGSWPPAQPAISALRLAGRAEVTRRASRSIDRPFTILGLNS